MVRLVHLLKKIEYFFHSELVLNHAFGYDKVKDKFVRLESFCIVINMYR